jgi:hypothetical protein
VKTVFFFEGKTQFQMIIKSFDCSRISVSVIMHFSYFYSTNYVCKVYVGRFVFLFSADYTYSMVLNSKRLNSYLQKTVSGDRRILYFRHCTCCKSFQIQILNGPMTLNDPPILIRVKLGFQIRVFRFQIWVLGLG